MLGEDGLDVGLELLEVGDGNLYLSMLLFVVLDKLIQIVTGLPRVAHNGQGLKDRVQL